MRKAPTVMAGAFGFVAAAVKPRWVGSGQATICQRRLAGVGSALPAASTARTENRCRPTRSRFSVRGELHGLHLRRSSLHSKRTPGSLAVKRNLAVRRAVLRFGPLTIVVSGGLVSGPGPAPGCGSPDGCGSGAG